MGRHCEEAEGRRGNPAYLKITGLLRFRWSLAMTRKGNYHHPTHPRPRNPPNRVFYDLERAESWCNVAFQSLHNIPFGNNPMSQPATPSPAAITREKLSEMIDHLRPDKELFSGRKFFERLIEYKSVEEVIAFVNKASAALDKQDGLDLYFDFDPVEKEVFDRTRLRMMSRREFLGVSAVGIAGGVFFTTGTIGAVKQVMNLAFGKEAQGSAPAPETQMDKMEEFIRTQIYPTGELLIGAALVNEAYEKSLELKLEQIADAVEMLGDKLRQAEALQV